MRFKHLSNYSQDKQAYPFRDYEYIASSEFSKIESEVGKIFEPRRYITKGQAEVRGSLIRLPFLDVGGAYFGGNVRELLNQESENYFLLAPLKGGVTSNHGQQEVKPQESALIISPGVKADLTWMECSAILIRIRPEVIHNYAEKFYGTGIFNQLQLPSLIDMRQSVGLSIANILHTMHSELEDDSSLLSQGITGRSLNEMLLTALLESGSRDVVLEPGFMGAKLKVAIEYIMENLQDEITITDLSTLTGVSTRKLQSDFSRHYGMGPMSFIRRERLKCVREELLRTQPDGVSVADVAFCWRFHNPSYFTKLYKKQFGENPSETLLSKS
jgi:AraC-like DNA-binding protein